MSFEGSHESEQQEFKKKLKAYYEKLGVKTGNQLIFSLGLDEALREKLSKLTLEDIESMAKTDLMSELTLSEEDKDEVNSVMEQFGESTPKENDDTDEFLGLRISPEPSSIRKTLPNFARFEIDKLQKKSSKTNTKSTDFVNRHGLSSLLCMDEEYVKQRNIIYAAEKTQHLMESKIDIICAEFKRLTMRLDYMIDAIPQNLTFNNVLVEEMNNLEGMLISLTNDAIHYKKPISMKSVQMLYKYLGYMYKYLGRIYSNVNSPISKGRITHAKDYLKDLKSIIR